MENLIFLLYLWMLKVVLSVSFFLTLSLFLSFFVLIHHYNQVVELDKTEVLPVL